MGSRPSTLGEWPLAYDRLGARLKQIGPHEIGYDRMGSRPRTIGPMTLHYDRLGSRARRVSVDGAATLSQDLAVALFSVLHHADQSDGSGGG
jgi:hypothetical protein